MPLPLPYTSRSLVAHQLCVVPETWQVAVAWTSTASRNAINFRFELPCQGVQFSSSESNPVRIDGLWQHTCVELFVAVPDRPAYREFNFATNGDWAAYDFSEYRVQSPQLPQIPSPRVETTISSEQIVVSVELEVACLPVDTSHQFGATVVLESRNGALSYWAVHHPCAQPDFHHRDGFVLLLS